MTFNAISGHTFKMLFLVFSDHNFQMLGAMNAVSSYVYAPIRVSSLDTDCLLLSNQAKLFQLLQPKCSDFSWANCPNANGCYVLHAYHCLDANGCCVLGTMP